MWFLDAQRAGQTLDTAISSAQVRLNGMPYRDFDGVTNMSSYLETLDVPTLGEIRAIIDRAASIAREHGDGLSEGMSYGMPCLLWKGKPLIAVIATRLHIGVYPYSGDIVSLVKEELDADGIQSTVGAIQVPYGTPLAENIIRTLVTAKIASIDA